MRACGGNGHGEEVDRGRRLPAVSVAVPERSGSRAAAVFLDRRRAAGACRRARAGQAPVRHGDGQRRVPWRRDERRRGPQPGGRRHPGHHAPAGHRGCIRCCAAAWRQARAAGDGPRLCAAGARRQPDHDGHWRPGACLRARCSCPGRHCRRGERWPEQRHAGAELRKGVGLPARPRQRV